MSQNGKRPVRILHVVGALNRAGTETWLTNVLRRIDRKRFQMDFLVHTLEPGAHDKEVRALGSQVIPCLYPEYPLVYAWNFKKALQEFGPYDILHSHVYHFSGFVLFLASRLGVLHRVAHSHHDTSNLKSTASFKRSLYLSLTKRMLKQYATAGFAVSRGAATDLYSPNWEVDCRWRLLHCGIDLRQFSPIFNPAKERSEIGIPEDAFVIGHVGRFNMPKNHAFILEVASKIMQKDVSSLLLLVGDGPLRSEIERKAARLGISDRVIFLGTRSDIPNLLTNVMDVFLFPSLHEGLGLALLEAQACGLPCIISDVIPKEADLIKNLVHRISLDVPVSNWVKTIMSARHDKMAQCEARSVVSSSVFNIDHSVKELSDFYASL